MSSLFMYRDPHLHLIPTPTQTQMSLSNGNKHDSRQKLPPNRVTELCVFTQHHLSWTQNYMAKSIFLTKPDPGSNKQVVTFTACETELLSDVMWTLQKAKSGPIRGHNWRNQQENCSLFPWQPFTDNNHRMYCVFRLLEQVL
jgi:hypothetical protein